MQVRTGTLLVVAAMATACGSGTSGSTASHGNKDVLAVIRAAASTNAAATSMRLRGHLAEKLDGVEAVAGQPAVTVDVSSDFLGDMQTTPTEARLTLSNMNVNGQSIGSGITELITPSAFYMNMPQLTGQTGKPWLEMKFSDMKAASGLDLKQLMSQAQQMQPAQYVQQLAAAGEVRVVGVETINGVRTTHYSGTVPIAEVLSHFRGAVRAQMAPVMRSAGFTGSTIDIWLDGKGLIRRARSVSQGGKGSVSMSMDVLAYGIHVDVTPPPADQVADFGQLAGAM